MHIALGGIVDTKQKKLNNIQNEEFKRAWREVIDGR